MALPRLSEQRHPYLPETPMKRIKILGIVLFSIFIALTAGDIVKNTINHHHDAPTVAYADPGPGYRMAEMEDLNVAETDFSHPACDSLYNRATASKVAVRVQQIGTAIRISSAAYYTQLVINGLAALLALYGLYCLVRMYLSLCKGEVLTRLNATRLRKFVYFFTLFNVVLEVERVIALMQVRGQLLLDGLRLNEGLTRTDWTCLLMLIFLTEVFALAVKLKEEQELTI